MSLASPEDFSAYETREMLRWWKQYFAPELRRRIAAGEFPEDFNPKISQILMKDGEGRIFFDDEVQVFALLRGALPSSSDGSLTLEEAARIEQIDLPEELLDHGHLTIVRSTMGWRVFFNLLQGRAMAEDMLERAGQFLEAAIASASKSHASPAIDNLFSSAELICKTELILHRLRGATAKTHRSVATSINEWGGKGNFDRAFLQLFNRLGNERADSRYGDKPSCPSQPSAKEFELVREMIVTKRGQIANATDDPSVEG